MSILIDSLLVAALLLSILVNGYVFIVVRALYTDLKTRGIAPELIPKTQKKRENPVTRARAHLKRGDTDVHG